MKKILQTVITTLGFLTFIIFFSSCEYVTNEYITQQASEKSKTFDVKVMSLNKKEVFARGVSDSGLVVNVDSMPLCFMEGKEEIPYIVVDSEILNFFYAPGSTLPAYEVSKVSSDTTQITIKNNYFNTSAVFDLTKHTLTFDNYDAFFQRVVSESKKVPVYYDVTDCMFNSDYLRIKEGGCTNIPGQKFVVNWSNLDIDVGLWNDDGTYNLVIPLQMFNDIFLRTINIPLVYNGSNIYVSALLLGNENLLSDFYETATSSTRSQALSDFCYNELCLNLDMNYGLKSIHGLDKFSSFDAFFTQTGIKKELTDPDPLVFSTALSDLITLYFDDGHSAVSGYSYFLDPNVSITSKYTSKATEKYSLIGQKYSTAMALQIPREAADKGFPAFTLSSDGKTAIVRFTSFTFNGLAKEDIKIIPDEKLKEYVFTLENEYDTVALIHTVNQKIKNTPSIKNVVLDLSCNGGGTAFSAAFILSWMLGDGSINLQNQITGAKWTTTYQADVNMDGIFDDNDTIKDKNLFCLISPVSFSCGNLVPAMLKDSGVVTILGVASTGGSCTVASSTTADGTMFNISSKYRISSRNNGSFYDIDRGIEPHVHINNPSNFYNVEYINNLIK